MRCSLVALITAASLLAAPAAMAAPTCLDMNGYTIRCGTPGAMPLGWKLPAEQRLERDRLNPIESHQLLEVICVLGVFFCLMAMLPEFDRWSDEEKS